MPVFEFQHNGYTYRINLRAVQAIATMPQPNSEPALVNASLFLEGQSEPLQVQIPTAKAAALVQLWEAEVRTPGGTR